MKAPHRALDEASRLDALGRYAQLNSPPDEALDELATLAGQIFEAPIALITLIGEDRQWCKARVGTSLTETSRDVSFCGHAILQRDLLIIPDTALDERFVDNPLVVGEPRIQFYAGAPLLTPDGYALGALCVLDQRPRQPTDSQLDALRVLSRQVMSQLELRRQARELGRSEERLNYALEATRDGLWDWNIATGQVYFSSQWARLLGYEPHEVPARVEFFFTVLHPEDVQRVQNVLEAHLAGRIPVKQDEIRLKMKSGGYRWFYDRGQVVVRDPSGSPLRMVGTITDITDRKQAEAALRISDVALKSISQGVLISAADGKIQSINKAFTTITGFTEVDMVGRDWDFILARLKDVRTVESIQVARRGGVEFAGEVMDHRKDGAPFWSEQTLTPVRDEYGGVSHFISIIRDVSGRRRLEDQVRQGQKMEAIGQLASGVAHDFNNILAAILGNAELALVDLEQGHPSRESLMEIKKASARAKSLVQQILAFSRQQPQMRSVISLGSIVEETSKFLRATVPASVELTFSLDPFAPCVLADPTQMHQLLVNLGTNAWHALENQPGRIEIKLESVILDSVSAAQLSGLRPGRFCRLTISDTGKGMDAATVERIFDPFFTTKEVGKGTGLGLSVVHGIVMCHDGAISVFSEPGKGAQFQIFLPAATMTEDLLPEGPPATPRGTGQRVLYLDDEASLVSLATRTLERLGYRVFGFTDPREAIEAFCRRSSDFDVVITDLNMPGVSGLQVAKELLDVCPQLPIILCSGRITEELMQSVNEAGIRHVLHKPATSEEFGEILCQIAEGGGP